MAKRSKKRQDTLPKPSSKPLPLLEQPLIRSLIFMSSLCLTVIVGIFAGRIYDSYSSGKPSLQVETVLWRVVDIPGKGKGVVALRNITQGTEVMREKPLFVVPPSTTEDPKVLIKSLVSQLSQQGQDSFNSLSHHAMPHAHGEELFLAKFQTNAISAGNMVGIFPRVARLNHACSAAFNVAYYWREHEKTLVLHAFKPIAEGEELFISYTDTKKPRHERRAYLQQAYNFHCTCAVCSLSDEDSRVSDERLVKMSSLRKELGKWENKGMGGQEATKLINEIWRIGESEGYWSERGSLAWDATQVAASHWHEEATREWATLAHKWFSIELGVDSSQALEAERVIQRPKIHRDWASRYRMKVDFPIETPH